MEEEFKSVDEYLDKEEIAEYELFNKRLKVIEEKQNDMMKLLGTILTEVQINQRDELPICLRGNDPELFKQPHPHEVPFCMGGNPENFKHLDTCWKPQQVNNSEPLSTSARKIEGPIAIFEKEDKKMNIRQRIEVWTDKEHTAEGNMNKIKASVTASKLDGSQQTNTTHNVNRKGIALFSDSELQSELDLYFGRLITMGLIKVK